MSNQFYGIKRFCAFYYELPDGVKPTRSQENLVTRMCREGRLPALKIGKKWFIDMDELLRGGKNDPTKKDATRTL